MLFVFSGLSSWDCPFFLPSIGFDINQTQPNFTAPRYVVLFVYDITTITLYNEAYISFEIGGFDMTFQVSEDTADDLNGYFE